MVLKTDLLAGLALDRVTEGGAHLVGNAKTKFRFGGNGFPPPEDWAMVNPDGHLVSVGGNSSGAGYIMATLDPRVINTEISMTSAQRFTMPIRFGMGWSMSQRLVGLEAFAGIVGCQPGQTGPELMTQVPDFSLTGCTVTVSSNVATVTCPAGTSVPFVGNDRVTVCGMTDSRLNVGPVWITRVSQFVFSFPVTVANGTYTSIGAYVRISDPLVWAKNGAGYLFGDNATVTNGSYYSRRNGSRQPAALVNQTVSTTTATQANTNPYTDAFNSASVYELESNLQEVSFRSWAANSVGGVSGSAKFTQTLPDDDEEYGLHFRVRHLSCSTYPVAVISSVAKTGTTTATVTTATPHGLHVGDYIMAYGTRDQTNFANLTTQTAVASIVSTTQFTVVWGSAVTASSTGGAVWRVQGSVVAAGQFAQVVQSMSHAYGVTTIVGNGTWATPLPGEIVFLLGSTSVAGADGFYKVLRVNTTSLELEPQFERADYTSTNTGGALIKPTDIRLHYVRLMDYTRHAVEITGGKSTSDSNNSVPVFVANGLSVTQAATSNRVGFTGAAGIWQDANSTALGVSAQYTGASRDLFAVATNTAFNVANYGKEYRVEASADVAGTLYLEVSTNSSTWRRVKAVPAVQAVGTGTVFYAAISHLPATRYVRAVFINGGTAQTFFLLQEAYFGA